MFPKTRACGWDVGVLFVVVVVGGFTEMDKSRIFVLVGGCSVSDVTGGNIIIIETDHQDLTLLQVLGAGSLSRALHYHEEANEGKQE